MDPRKGQNAAMSLAINRTELALAEGSVPKHAPARGKGNPPSYARDAIARKAEPVHP